MPSLPSKTTRRKHVTPIANLHENDVWQRTFNLLGLEPLTPFSDVNPKEAPCSLNLEMASTTDIVAPSIEMAKPEKPKISILDLPSETQKDIFKHASSTDLIALSLVSRHFRDIAAAQLYRNFHIVFPDEDDPSYESPIDGLAGGLDTLVTSDYDYARYLKEIVLDTLSGGTKGERAYRHYTYDLSCGKFMNTLFLLALRRAHALETFKWDLRVEISRPVFKALHQLKALQHLHLRMHSGPSLYEIPPPLPSSAESESDGPSTLNQPSSLAVVPPPNPPHSYPIAKSALKYKSKSKDVAIPAKVPPTFSGFKNLKSLSILDMDTLEYVTEIKACIRSSSSTLNKLKISLSESLARQARKPPPAEDPGDESDQEIDEFGNMIPPPPPPPVPSSTEDAAGPAKAFRAQEEKKAQEAVLGRIFGVEPFILKKSDGGSKDASDSEEKEKEEKPDPGKAFIKDLTALSKKLMISINGTSTRTQQQKDALEIIEKAAKKYVEAKEEEKARVEKKGGEDVVTTGSSTAKPTPESSAASVTGKPEDEAGAENKSRDAEVDEKPSGMFDEQHKKERKSNQATEKGSNPEDINVDEPEVVADLKDFEDVSASEAQTEGKSPHVGETALVEPSGSASTFTEVSAEDLAKMNASNAKRLEVTAQLGNFKILKDKLLRHKSETEELNRRITVIATAKEVDKAALDEAQRQQLQLQAEVDSATAQMNALGAEVAELKQRAEAPTVTLQEQYLTQMNEYVRNTRGLGLHSLSIYLIPIKASVLSKAVDITVLRRISLLNVGPQGPFWNLLAKENKAAPLPLQKIHTDNVTPQFLTLVAQLDTLRELFLLERNSKVPEYSFAPKTTVTIDHIRKQILKRHIGTLQKLMIKNENDYTWDANEQVIKLLCKRGKQLEELALSFGVRAVHTFNQYLPGLLNLRAMHMISFRNEDTCHWVVREIRKFAVDSVSHNPEMKLEYIALENTVERLVRRAKKTKSKGKGKAIEKGKGKESAVGTASGGPVFPTLDSILAPSPVSESSEEEDLNSEDEVGPGLKLETLEGVRFYDIFGVTIFRKDIMMGRL